MPRVDYELQICTLSSVKKLGPIFRFEKHRQTRKKKKEENLKIEMDFHLKIGNHLQTL